MAWEDLPEELRSVTMNKEQAEEHMALWKSAADEPLLSELEPYVNNNGNNGMWINHPLIIQPLVMPGWINWTYTRKMAILAELEDKDEFLKTLYYYEKPYRLHKLAAWFYANVISADDLREYLPGVWCGTEMPLGQMEEGDDSRDIWVDLFQNAGFLTDTDCPPPETGMTIYRGGHPEGMSWSLNRVTAEWFSQRGHRAVYSAVIPAGGILAVFINTRSEAEIVVDPDYLLEVTCLVKSTEWDGD